MIQNGRVMCFGEPLIGFFTKNDFHNLPSFQMAIGGDTSNVALGVSKLGHTASFTTKLGNDFFALKIMEAWQKENIDTRYVFRENNFQTGIYFSIYDSQGDNEFVYKRKDSASSRYSAEEAKRVTLEDLTLFHLSGISQAISTSCLEASFFFMNRCKELNIQISYDLNYRSLLWSKEYFNSIALYTIKNFADIVSLNLKEAEVLGLHGSPKEIVKQILIMGPKVVALKLGKDGCVIGTPNEIEYGKPFKVDNLVEATGAGDSLTAALIVGIMEQMKLKKLVSFANAVASRVCTVVGSTSGQPSRKEIDLFLEYNQ